MEKQAPIRFHVLAYLFFMFLHPVCFSQQSGQEMRDTRLAQKLMDDFQTYSTFTANFTSYSDLYADKFKGLFDQSATLFNPFTDQIVNPEEFSEYVKKNFSSGIYLEFSSPANLIHSRSEQDHLILSFETEIRYIGVFNAKKRFEEQIPAIILISINKLNSKALIRNIYKKETREFTSIDVQLIDLKKPSNSPQGIAVQLVLHDSVFQESVSNQNGLATFVGVPFRDAYSLSLSKKPNILFRKPILYSSDTLLNSKLKYFLPLVYTSNETRFLSLGFFGAKQLIEYSEPTVNDSINYDILKGDGYQFSFNVVYIQSILKWNYSELSIETGLQFEYANYTISSSNLQHGLYYEFKPSQIQFIEFNASTLDFEADEINLKIPLYVVYNHKLNLKWPVIAEFGGGINFLVQLNSYYNQRTEYSVEGQNNNTAEWLTHLKPYLSYTYTKKRYQAFSSTGLQYTLFVGFKVNFPASKIKYGLRLKYLGSFENSNTANKNSIFEDNLYSPMDITKIMKKKTVHAFGLELSATIPLNF